MLHVEVAENPPLSSSVNVTLERLPVKPVPVTVTVSPTYPKVLPPSLIEVSSAWTEINCVTSSLFTDAKFVPSDAVTVCGPLVAAGTMNVQVAMIVPSASVLHVPLTPAFAPLSVKLIVADAANPAPATVTVLPTYVALGALTEIEGTTVIVCVTAALFADAELPSVSVAVTVCEPAVASGTVNVHVPVIVPSVFVLHVALTDPAAPLSVKLIVSLK